MLVRNLMLDEEWVFFEPFVTVTVLCSPSLGRFGLESLAELTCSPEFGPW